MSKRHGVFFSFIFDLTISFREPWVEAGLTRVNVADRTTHRGGHLLPREDPALLEEDGSAYRRADLAVTLLAPRARAREKARAKARASSRSSRLAVEQVQVLG